MWCRFETDQWWKEIVESDVVADGVGRLQHHTNGREPAWAQGSLYHLPGESREA